jgi:hypothetical protein
MRYVANAGSNGFELSGGTVRLVNCHIDTSANANTNPITKSGGTLELVNCTLLAEGTRNAIEAASAQTVQVRGVLSTNRPSHANVTFSGGVVVRTDTGTVVLGSTTVEKVTTADGTGRIYTGAAAVRVGANSGAGANLNTTPNSVFVGTDAGSGSGGSRHTIVGHGANSSGESFRTDNTAVGYGASANDSFATAFGASATAQQRSVAFGYSASSQGEGVAIGSNATTFAGLGGIAIGAVATAAKGQVVLQPDTNSTGTTAKTCNVFLQAYSATTIRNIGVILSEWADATDATRAGRLTLGAYSVTTHQEGVRVEANAAGVRLGFFGGAAVAKPAVTGSRGGNAAFASLLSHLAALGLITDSTSA